MELEPLTEPDLHLSVLRNPLSDASDPQGTSKEKREGTGAYCVEQGELEGGSSSIDCIDVVSLMLPPVLHPHMNLI
ncbi:hypothetical protein COLO4_05662 [Corchorus olitorius]|uniref:Uncharacterized protein n=1 Tax=Corchorus olitorius TaxID=93759 RepID=A0A1R3KQ71_9ROSI|nr:hypothetical protein COLO4_05662 [Corchorus olitorius]